MEQGNEGDEIILFSFRQIECPLGPEIVSIGQMTPQLLVEIVARSLWLISDGEIKISKKFSPTLPNNVASKHRICTNMANKIKELGFTGECGYNQLLYPNETQTRTLLTWLVQRLPRSEEERAEEVLGANALLNRRMTQSLEAWKTQSWRLPYTAVGTPLVSLHHNRTLRTNLNQLTFSNPLALFSTCNQKSLAPEPSIIEKHTFELLRDAKYTSQLVSSMGEEDDNLLDSRGGTGSSNNRHKRSADKMDAIVRNAFQSVKQLAMNFQGQGGMGGPGSGVGTNNNGSTVEGGGAGGGGELSVDQMKQGEMLQMSFQELVSSLGGAASESESSSGSSERVSRFAHATEFSQDSVVSVGGGSTSSTGGAVAAAVLAASSSSSTIPGVDRDAALSALRGAMDAEDSATRQARIEEELSSRESELETIRKELQGMVVETEGLERQISNDTAKMRQLESELSSLSSQTEATEKDILIKKKTLEMLPSATDNITKLQTICGTSAKRLMQLAQEWETHRIPLIEKYRSKKSLKMARKNRCKLMVEEMKKTREEMVGMLQDLKDKQEKSQVLAEEVSKLPKNLNRALYTHRILDIINSIAKQNKDISRIVSDIRDVQKQINTSSSTRQRADLVTDELVFQAANSAGSDPATVATYRQLRALRGNFDSLINVINKLGALNKMQRDLETKIDQEQSRVSSNNLERISGDLLSVQQENAELVTKIKTLSARR